MVICLERDADLHTAQLIPLPLIVSFELFSYDNSPNEDTVKFLAKFGAISPWHIDENRGMRRRIQSRDIEITPHPQLFAAYSRAVHSQLVLRSNG